TSRTIACGTGYGIPIWPIYIAQPAARNAHRNGPPNSGCKHCWTTNTLAPEALSAWCRERGIFAHQLQAWKAEFCLPAKPAADTAEVRKLKGELTSLQRELSRKDKALSEAAALLVLQKTPGAVGGRGQMTSLGQRQTLLSLIDEAVAAGARAARAQPSAQAAGPHCAGAQ